MIRHAREHEFDLIRKQRLAAYEIYSGKIPAAHWDFLKSGLVAESDRDPGVEVFVYELDGNIAGSIALFPSKAKAYEWHADVSAYPEIRMLAVEPSSKGKGIAKALVQHCINHSAQKKYPFIGLHTGSFMAPAMALYEGMGFERVPALDVEPMDDGIVIKAYQRSL